LHHGQKLWYINIFTFYVRDWILIDIYRHYLFNIEFLFIEPHYKKHTSDIDEDLKASGDKIKEIAESFALVDPHYNPHRKSGGGFEDYLDEKTLARLEELKIIDPHSSSDKPYIDHPPTSNSRQPKDEYATPSSGPNYLEISKQVCFLCQSFDTFFVTILNFREALRCI